MGGGCTGMSTTADLLQLQGSYDAEGLGYGPRVNMSTTLRVSSYQTWYRNSSPPPFLTTHPKDDGTSSQQTPSPTGWFSLSAGSNGNFSACSPLQTRAKLRSCKGTRGVPAHQQSDAIGSTFRQCDPALPAWDPRSN